MVKFPTGIKYYLLIHSGFHFDLTFYDEFTSKKCGLINKQYISHRNSNPFFEFVSSKSDTMLPPICQTEISVN